MKTKKYRVWAGEGELGHYLQGTIKGYATTLRGARRMATIAQCGGDRWARIEMDLEGQKNSLGQDLTGWMILTIHPERLNKNRREDDGSSKD